MNRLTTRPRATASGMTPCALCPLRKSPAFREFTEPELDFVESFKTAELKIAPGTSVLVEGTKSPHLFTVLAGWAFRYTTLDDGRRQILNYVMPGDLVGLQSSVFAEMQHSVEALTEVTLCVFPRDRLWSLYRDHPGLGLDITWLMARQEFVLDESLVSLGRRSARERIAFLLLHLYQRAAQVGLAADDELVLPFTQQHFADTLGLSLVHTNKTLRQLAHQGLAEWRGGRLRILDADGLTSAAAFDPTRETPRPFI